jgi:cysteinyl-tRNA synthetase
MLHKIIPYINLIYIDCLVKEKLKMKNALHITDSLTKRKKKISFSDADITMYVCGITPYDDAHIGHARCYVTYDIVLRLVRFFCGKIMYVRNVTDVNQKLEDRAFLEYGDKKKFYLIADRYYQIFKKNIAQLNCIDVDYAPKVTESINEIILFISQLINAGFAYEKDDGVYFNVEKYPEYGTLSRRLNQKEDETISRLIDLHKKENNLDFVLWKKHEEEPHWPSPWGNGSPGWHIECSAMIKKSFSRATIDIHGGGLDLIFPHHENEKAQTECLTRQPLAHVWMHVAPVLVGSQKMSKSFGNSITLESLFSACDPMILRFYFLMHGYNTPMEFLEQQLEAIKKNFIQIKNLLTHESFLSDQYSVVEENIIQEMYDFLCDDLNTAAVIGLCFKYKKEIYENRFLNKKVRDIFQYILGLRLCHPVHSCDQQKEISAEIKGLIEERDNARAKKDFFRADEIRDMLKSKGYEIKDKKS